MTADLTTMSRTMSIAPEVAVGTPVIALLLLEDTDRLAPPPVPPVASGQGSSPGVGQNVDMYM
jgi:hypothetical protein